MKERADILLSVIAPIEVEPGAWLDDCVDEIAEVVRKTAAQHEIILVDDGILDPSADRIRPLLARHEFLRVLRLSRHFGEEAAIAAGLDASIGDFVVVMLPHTDPPSLIPEFVERARTAADIVYGVRRHRKGEPWWYRLGARAFYWYMNRVLGAGIPEDSTQFRCMSRSVVNAISRTRDPDRYLRLLTSYIGFTKAPLEYGPVNRAGRPPVRSRGESLGLARAMVMDQSAHPLRLVSWTAVMASLIFFAIAAWQVLRGAGLLPLAMAAAFLCTTLVLAVLAEYVAEMARRTRGRPSYYVRDEDASALLPRELGANVVAETMNAGVHAQPH